MLLHRFPEAVDMERCKWMSQIRTLFLSWRFVSSKRTQIIIAQVIVFLLIASQRFPSPLCDHSALAAPRHIWLKPATWGLRSWRIELTRWLIGVLYLILFSMFNVGQKITRRFVNVASIFDIQSWICRIVDVVVQWLWRRMWSKVTSSSRGHGDIGERGSKIHCAQLHWPAPPGSVF